MIHIAINVSRIVSYNACLNSIEYFTSASIVNLLNYYDAQLISQYDREQNDLKR